MNKSDSQTKQYNQENQDPNLPTFSQSKKYSGERYWSAQYFI